MPKYVQTDRPLQITTPLGKDVLLITALRGREALSELFHFELDTVAELGANVQFDMLLGKSVTVQIVARSDEASKRYINGMVKRVTQGERTEEFTRYYLEVVPQFWLFTRRMQSRTFQQKTIPQILQKVLEGLDVSWELQGDWKEREYCIQYQETDFNFACRLMEEEGIYYYFKHSDGGHKMVVANTPQSHADLPFLPEVRYEDFFGHAPQDERVFDWHKGQEIRSGKCTTWDEHFQLIDKHLEADKTIQDTVQAGTQSHKLTAGGGSRLELYEFPGEYSRHFDGINKGNGDQPDHLQWIFTENVRTVGIRMQQEASGAVEIEARSGHPGMSAGHAFTLTNHFSDNGRYVVTSVEHDTQQPMGVQGSDETYTYVNRLTCVPSSLPFRPLRITPVPSVRGVQTATVVGPPGEEIYVDKYSRVKVQFRWDREGKKDADSSCWMRVATFWAGKNWGAIHIPRIGQEVLVAFEEGDVDHPVIVGSLYNADMMPPYKLPDKKTVATVKSRSTKQGTPSDYNELRFEDLKAKEQLFFHAQRDKDERVKNDSREIVLHDRSLVVGHEKDGQKVGDQKEKVFQDKHTTIERHYKEKTSGNHEVYTKGNVIEKTDGNNDYTLGGDNTVSIAGKHQIKVGGEHREKIGGKMSITVGGSIEEKSGTKFAHEAGQEIHLKAGMHVVIEGGLQLTLKVGGNFIDINPAGVFIQGTMVMINSGGAAGSGSGASPDAPAAPNVPTDPELPDVADDGPAFGSLGKSQ